MDALPVLCILPPRKPTDTSSCHGPVAVLAAFAKKWSMDTKYQLRMLKGKINSDGSGVEPTMYKTIVTVGVRKGEGVGPNVAEAKAIAAQNCLSEMLSFLPEEIRPSFRKVVPTDPKKDILYILYSACMKHGFQLPAYTFEQNGTNYKCTATIGELKTFGEASKKREAIRVAAVEMYNVLRELSNTNRIPDSVRTIHQVVMNGTSSDQEQE